MAFKKYIEIPRLGHEDCKDLLAYNEDTLVVEEKIDGGNGCHENHTPILLSTLKTEKIGLIVNNRLKVKVKSFNFKTHKIENVPIKKYFKSKRNEDFLKLECNLRKKQEDKYANGKNCSNPTSTINHLYYTEKGWKRLDCIKKGDFLWGYGNPLSEKIKEAVYGSLLGDGGLTNRKLTSVPSFRISQKMERKSYINHWLNLLGGTLNNFISGYGFPQLRLDSQCWNDFLFIERNCYINNKKQLNKNWLDKLTWISLAYLYMDNGSLRKNKRCRAALHTEGRTLKEVKLLSNLLKNKFKLKNTITNPKKEFYIITISAYSTDLFFKEISPYILPIFNYKIDFFKSKKKIIRKEFAEGLVPYKVKGISKKLSSNAFYKYMYDLNIKNGNYFVGRLLCHNSFWQEDDVIHFGSRNRDLTLENDTKIFEGFQKQLREHLANLEKEGIKINPDYFYYFEWMGTHTIHYTKAPFIIGFDIRLRHAANQEGEGLFLGREAREQEFNRLRIENVPLIWRGTVKELKEKNIRELIPKSKYYDGMAEGILIKNYCRKHSFGNYQIMGKLVRDEFKEDNKAVFGNVRNKTSDTSRIITEFCTDARIRKAVLHFLDNGDKLELKLMAKVPHYVIKDVMKEEILTIIDKYKFLDLTEMRQKVPKLCLRVISEMMLEKTK